MRQEEKKTTEDRMVVGWAFADQWTSKSEYIPRVGDGH